MHSSTHSKNIIEGVTKNLKGSCDTAMSFMEYFCANPNCLASHVPRYNGLAKLKLNEVM